MTIDELRTLLEAPNMRAFLAVIRAGEGTADPDGYRRLFGGELVNSYADHPRRAVTRTLGGRPITSTAAGAYQFLSRTWDGLVRQYGFSDFYPASQDLAAVALIVGRGAAADVVAGRIEAAIAKCNREWASLPGSPYGQPTRTLAQSLATFAEAGGVTVAAPQATPTIKPAPQGGFAVPPFLLAALPALIEAIPKLGKLFGSGSEAQQRNIAAAQTVAEIVQTATGSKNIQEAVETIKADPQALQAASQAVEARWFELAEAGGGGIEGARNADAEARASGGQVWRSPSWWALLLLLPLVYMVVGSVSGLWGYAAWSDDVRAAIATAVISLVVGGAAGYYWGSTTSRNRTQAGG